MTNRSPKEVGRHIVSEALTRELERYVTSQLRDVHATAVKLASQPNRILSILDDKGVLKLIGEQQISSKAICVRLKPKPSKRWVHVYLRIRCKRNGWRTLTLLVGFYLPGYEDKQIFLGMNTKNLDHEIAELNKALGVQ